MVLLLWSAAIVVGVECGGQRCRCEPSDAHTAPSTMCCCSTGRSTASTASQTLLCTSLGLLTSPSRFSSLPVHTRMDHTHGFVPSARIFERPRPAQATAQPQGARDAHVEESGAQWEFLEVMQATASCSGPREQLLGLLLGVQHLERVGELRFLLLIIIGAESRRHGPSDDEQGREDGQCEWSERSLGRLERGEASHCNLLKHPTVTTTFCYASDML